MEPAAELKIVQHLQVGGGAARRRARRRHARSSRRRHVSSSSPAHARRPPPPHPLVRAFICASRAPAVQSDAMVVRVIDPKSEEMGDGVYR